MLIAISTAEIFDLVKILYGILIGVVLIFANELMIRYLHADKQTRMDAAYLAFLIIAYSLFGYAIYLMLALGNYGLIAGIDRTKASMALQIFLVIIILTPMAVVSEKLLFKKNNAVISILVGTWIVNYTLILTLFSIIDSSLNMNLLFIPVYISFAVLGIIDFLGFILIFFKRLRSQKEITTKIRNGFICLIGTAIGAVIAIFGRDPPNILYVVGTIIEILAWLGVRYFFLEIPSYGEFEWRDGLCELYIIVENSGTTIYTKYFKAKAKSTDNQEVNLPDSELVGGGMIGIQAILEQIAKTSGLLENVSIGNKNLYFVHGEFMLCVLITDKKLGVYSGILNSLVRDIELNNPSLSNFGGEISRYKKSIEKSIVEIIETPKKKKEGSK
jgi:hypothetical protein